MIKTEKTDGEESRKRVQLNERERERERERVCVCVWGGCARCLSGRCWQQVAPKRQYPSNVAHGFIKQEDITWINI